MNVKRSVVTTFDVTCAGARRTQYGALCWHNDDGRVEVLLVTSRETGRWVIPKGWPVEGQAPAEDAAREAWEEAGVRGQVSHDCLGVYTYDKVVDRDGASPSAVPCVVAVYALQVSATQKSFPEASLRRQKWFSREKAARKVLEPELATLIAGFDPDALR